MNEQDHTPESPTAPAGISNSAPAQPSPSAQPNSSAASASINAAAQKVQPTSSMQQARQPREKPKGIVILLYFLLMVSAAVALLSFSSQLLPDSARLVGPIAFAAFYAIFVIYRIVMIRRRRYPVTKAVFQIGLGVIFLMVLFSVRPQAPGNAPLKPAAELLRHADPSVRALACDVLTAQGGASLHAAVGELQKLQSDSHPEVREHAAKALAKANAASDAAVPESN